MTAVTLENVPEMNVLGISRTGPYTIIPELLMEVWNYISEKKIAVSGPPIFLCSECSPEAVKEAQEKGNAVVEVAWPVNGRVRGNGIIRAYTLPGGTMAHAIHKGPYESCEPTYLDLFQWIQEKGLSICGPIREVYPNDPREVPPEEIRMEIYVPVRQPR